MAEARDRLGADGAAGSRRVPDAAWVLRLALGLHESELAGAPWRRVLRVAIEERCAPLCWLRSGAAIRRLAPRDVVSEWREHALATAARADQWIGRLGECLSALGAAGVSPVILKGLPLGQRLYGSLAARPTADLDLFVQASRRAVAHRALESAGWRHCFGRGDDEGVYLKEDGRRWLLEVHSSLADDNLVRHLRLPAPEAESLRVGDVPCPAMSGDLLPGYLALHLAKHQLPPLLWLVDFFTLWQSLASADRARAKAVAAVARIDRYLARAVAIADVLADAARGQPDALRACGLREDGRAEDHNALRLARLAASPADAVRVATAWLLPRELRRHPLHLARKTLWRLQRPLLRSWRREMTYPAEHALPSARTIEAHSTELLALAREVLAMGGGMWVRAKGLSMVPAIPPGSRIRLEPAPARKLAPGEVVLAQLPSGEAVIHRVVSESEGLVRLRGDGNNSEDPPIDRSRVLGIADRVQVGGVVQAIPAARPSAAMRLRRARSRVHTLLAGSR